MSENNPSTDTHEIENDLVAYLDGELDATATARVERELSENAEYRRKLHSLQLAWDLMDTLPRADVDESFTRSTVEMVAVSTAEDVREAEQQMTKRQHRWWIAVAATCLLSAVMGYGALATILGDPNADLLADLSLYQRFDLYRHAGTVDFVKQLHNQDWLGEQPDEDVIQQELARLAPIDNPAAGRQRVKGMSTAEKESLRQRMETFSKLPPREQTHLRQLHQELSRPDNQPLFETLVRYNEWLKDIPSSQQMELLQLDTEDRLLEVQRLAQQQKDEHLFARHDQAHRSSDMLVLMPWVANYFRMHEQQIVAAMPVEERQRFEQTPSGRRLIMSLMMRSIPRELLPPATPEEIEYLLRQVTPEVRRMLESTSDPQKQTWIALNLVRAAIQRRFRSAKTNSWKSTTGCRPSKKSILTACRATRC